MNFIIIHVSKVINLICVFVFVDLQIRRFVSADMFVNPILNKNIDNHRNLQVAMNLLNKLSS